MIDERFLSNSTLMESAVLSKRDELAYFNYTKLLVEFKANIVLFSKIKSVTHQHCHLYITAGDTFTLPTTTCFHTFWIHFIADTAPIIIRVMPNLKCNVCGIFGRNWFFPLPFLASFVFSCKNLSKKTQKQQINRVAAQHEKKNTYTVHK